MSNVKINVTNPFYYKGKLVERGDTIEVDTTIVPSLIEMQVIAEVETVDETTDGNKQTEKVTGGERVAEVETVDETTDGADHNSTSDETTKTGRGRANSGAKK